MARKAVARDANPIISATGGCEGGGTAALSRRSPSHVPLLQQSQRLPPLAGDLGCRNTAAAVPLRLHPAVRGWRAPAAALIASIAAPALACTCENPAQLSPAQLENDLRLMTSRPLHIGRVVRLDSGLSGQARRYRVIEDLTGNLPGEIIVWPSLTRLPDGRTVEGPITSCDFDGEPGKIVTMAFQPRQGRFESPPCGVLGPANDSGLRSAGQCVNLWLTEPKLRDRLIAAARAQAGVSRSSRPPSSSR